MNENDGSTARGFDPDTAPDLSKDGWPEKFAKLPVRRGRPPKARAESHPGTSSIGWSQTGGSRPADQRHSTAAQRPRLFKPSGGAET